LPKEFKVISLRASAKKIAEALPRQTRKLSKIIELFAEAKIVEFPGLFLSMFCENI
jgi:hypothetical protein